MSPRDQIALFLDESIRIARVVKQDRHFIEYEIFRVPDLKRIFHPHAASKHTSNTFECGYRLACKTKDVSTGLYGRTCENTASVDS